MAIVQKKLIGIDIGVQSIKMVKMNRRGRVVRYAFVDLPEKVIVNGKIESRQMLVETLRLARKKLGSSFRHCALCLNSPEIIIRQILIPQMEEKYIEKNIMLELADFLPGSPEKYTMDFIITDRIETEEKKQFQILAFAIPTEVVKSYADCIKAAGLKLHYVDIMENAYEKLFRMLKNKGAANESHFACLFIDYSKASAGVYGNGKFFINKVIDNGTIRVCEEIAEKTGKPADLVKKLIFTNDILTYGETFVVEKSVIENYVRDLSFEIVRVMDYFKSRSKGASVGIAYLSGCLSHVTGIQSCLEGLLNVPVLCTSQFTDPMFKNIPKKNNGIDYTNAIAITLREENP